MLRVLFQKLQIQLEKLYEIIIKKAGKPVAILLKYESHKVKRQPGALKGQIEIAEDFDELPSDIALVFGMELPE